MLLLLRLAPSDGTRSVRRAASVKRRSRAAEVSLAEKETTRACSKFSKLCLI